MTLSPNANWNAAIDDPQLSAVYYLAIEGLTAWHLSTGPVKGAATTKKPYLAVPRGAGGSVDLIGGSFTLGQLQVDVVDVDDELTDLVSTQAAGALLGSLKNRKCTLYAGYAHLDESDYAAVGTWRIAGVEMLGDLTGYRLTLAEPLFLLDAEIMTNATEAAPTTIRGNVVNLAASILRGVFSVSDPDFPLDYVSTATGSSSAPTGLGIPDAQLDVDQIKAERDRWHPDDVGQVVFVEPETGKDHLEQEFFRTFQARPIVSGEGKIGIQFNVPPLPAAAAPTVDLSDIVEVRGWKQLFDDHLNKFRIRGDYDVDAETFADLYDTETSEDTANQAATGETIEYLVESRWLDSDYDGEEIAAELAGRMRLTYLDCPAEIQLSLLFRKRNLEPGDVVALTHPSLPDLRAGTRGLVGRLMAVLRVDPNYPRGLVDVDLLDLGYRRYGVVAGSGQADYLSSTDQEINTFGFVSDNADQLMSDDSPGYRLI